MGRGLFGRWGVGRGLVIVTALSLGGSAEAAPREPIDIQGLQLADGRLMPEVPSTAWGDLSGVDPRAYQPVVERLRRDEGPVWVHWDSARQHPAGIITSGIAAPGTVGSPTRAEAFTHAWLARNIDILAPGASLHDFVVVSNDLSSGIRTLGLQQHHAGVPVIGGQLSVRFKADRLVYVASQALPDVALATRTTPTIEPSRAFDAAVAWIEADFPGATPSTSGTATDFVLPVWSGGGWTYHEVVRVAVESASPMGQWWVYVDAGTGLPVAREQRLRSVGTVQFNVPERQPFTTRYDAVAPDLDVLEGGMGATTDANGEVVLSGSPTTLELSVNGPFVDVVNDAGAEAVTTVPVTDGETVVWDAADDEFVDAQLSAFVHTSLVKEHVRQLAPGLAWLDDTIQVSVNIGGSCNAASNGNDIFFLQGNESCQNTARLADVVYHEVGHSVHRQSIIDGVGAFEGALSEGISDYLAATIVDDPGMGRGFFLDDDPLRQLDPMGYEWSWPMDKGAVHAEGRIIGGTLWDLRTSLMATLGDEAGRNHTDMIWYEATRRAVDIPSMYPEALVYDDDDGNLANGTPNGCEINAAFEAHGLLDPTAVGDVSIELVQELDGRDVVIDQTLPDFDACPVIATGGEMRYRVRGEMETVTESMVLEDGHWVATIPPHDPGVVVEYQVTMEYSGGMDVEFPRNRADRWYQTFYGGAVPIYCLDDMADLGQWSFGGGDGGWGFGPLAGGSATDPELPYDEDGVLLSQDGMYPNWTTSWVVGPMIDIAGYADVRLHYRRWLSVEDAVYDQARVFANGDEIWMNEATMSASTHHIDHEWRFHDLPLSDYIAAGQVELAFSLASDGGLEFGGWTVDGLCVVEVVDAVCGDGWISGEEECDDGNTDSEDGCDAECVLEEVEPPPSGTTGGEDDTGDGDTGDDDSGGGTTGRGDGAADDTAGPGPLTTGPAEPEPEGSTGGDAGQAPSAGSDGCGCVARGSSEEPLRAAWLLPMVLLGLRRRGGTRHR